MQMGLAFAYVLISPGGLRKEASEDLILLTVDGEFCRLAVAAIADGVAGHAAVGASVLLLHRADDQSGVVLREAVSVAGAQRHAVSQPLKCDPCSSFDSAGPGHVCLVLHHGVRRALGNHWDGHGDWGKTEEELLSGRGRRTTGQVVMAAKKTHRPLLRARFFPPLRAGVSCCGTSCRGSGGNPPHPPPSVF